MDINVCMVRIRSMVRKQLVEYFANKLDIQLVVLFGSQAHQTAKNDSDVDVALLANKSMSTDELIELQLALSSKLSKEVDVVDLSVSHGAILDEVFGRGDLLINRNPELYAKLLKRMWYEKEDDARFTQKTYEERLRIWQK